MACVLKVDSLNRRDHYKKIEHIETISQERSYSKCYYFKNAFQGEEEYEYDVETRENLLHPFRIVWVLVQGQDESVEQNDGQHEFVES